MDSAGKQVGKRVVDLPVPGKDRSSAERLCDDDDVEVPTFPCARVTGMQVTVVADLQPDRRQRGRQPLTDQRRNRGAHGGVGRSSGSRCSQIVWPIRKTSSAPVTPNTLNFAHTSCGV